MWNEIAGNPLFDLLLLIIILRIVFPRFFRRNPRTRTTNDIPINVKTENPASKKKPSGKSGEYIDFEEIRLR